MILQQAAGYQQDTTSYSFPFIPGVIKPAPYWILGNPENPCWIPAGVYPVLDAGQE